MARTAQPVAPGTDPATTTQPSALALAGGLETNTDDLKPADSASAAPAPAAAAPAGETTDEKLERQQRELDDLRALIHQMGKNQAVATAEEVKLPSMKAVQKQNPSIPVLTEDGWFVPAVHPTDRISKLG